jgi:cellulose synthase/poly-beta-1,6-N-acetylglucosamine synthase-like glycosyltransferase
MGETTRGQHRRNRNDVGPRRERPSEDASRLLSRGQLALVVVTLAAIGGCAYVHPRRTAVAVVGACTVFYVLTAALKLAVTLAGNAYRPLRRVVVPESELPPYAVLLPVHKEANMLGHLVTRVQGLRYPRDKIRILLLIEHDDLETLEAARKLRIPFIDDGSSGGYGSPLPGRHTQVLVIPPGGPKTKPNAMNEAIRIVLDEQCEFLTIYDAEDRPDPEQLLKAVATFSANPPDLACLQAELAFWNDDDNWISAMYWVGYKIHFTRFLPGLARLGLPVPLGGTSNHFRVSALRDVALRPGGEVWDPHNLTEDADLGARLAAGGYRVDLLPSTTMEEAPIGIKVIDKQQRRWKAGYLQTALVHMRHPLRSMRRMGVMRWICFNLLVLGVPISFMLNPVFIAVTVTYLATKSVLIQDVFPTSIYYPALAVMILGNLAVVYEHLETCLGAAERSRGRYGLLPYMLSMYVMWLWMSRSTYIAVFELITGKRAWHKTPHGHAEAEFDELLEPVQAGS